jgi:glycosyltransferase involved in cell wall biosynthesis
MTLGIDIEQFARDPYGSGIQRVLQHLALNWPHDIPAVFIVPVENEWALLTPAQAAELIGIPFELREADADLRALVTAGIKMMAEVRVTEADLSSHVDAWLLPEVSYLPSVLTRLERFEGVIPTAMIGYDALPMTHPANYRFAPGNAGWVSEYFRHLTRVDSVICISDYAAREISQRLRRDSGKLTTVAHPGGDHLPSRTPWNREISGPTRFLRVGTMEARKQPLEILEGFRKAIQGGASAELVYVGKPSASDERINEGISAAIAEGLPVTWVSDADDARVYDELHRADVFLSIGVEGYGIPVLESIRLSTPVIYDGIQPAGEIMEGMGARRVNAASEETLASMFREYGDDARRNELADEIQLEAIPTWRDFTGAVARHSATRPSTGGNSSAGHS